MNDIFSNYCSLEGRLHVARFLTIYISEAHAKDEWRLPDSFSEQQISSRHGCDGIAHHKNLSERLAAATHFVKDFNIKFEVVCDSMKDEANACFDAWPERLYIIQNGIVVYKGGYGPFDYKLAEVKDWLAAKFGLFGNIIDRR
jgi:hypothetical protein